MRVESLPRQTKALNVNTSIYPNLLWLPVVERLRVRDPVEQQRGDHSVITPSSHSSELHSISSRPWKSYFRSGNNVSSEPWSRYATPHVITGLRGLKPPSLPLKECEINEETYGNRHKKCAIKYSISANEKILGICSIECHTFPKHVWRF